MKHTFSNTSLGTALKYFLSNRFRVNNSPVRVHAAGFISACFRPARLLAVRSYTCPDLLIQKGGNSEKLTVKKFLESNTACWQFLLTRFNEIFKRLQAVLTKVAQGQSVPLRAERPVVQFHPFAQFLTVIFVTRNGLYFHRVVSTSWAFLSKFFAAMFLALVMCSCSTYRCYPSKGSKDYAYKVINIVHQNGGAMVTVRRFFGQDKKVFYECLPDSVKKGSYVRM